MVQTQLELGGGVKHVAAYRQTDHVLLARSSSHTVTTATTVQIVNWMTIIQ